MLALGKVPDNQQVMPYAQKPASLQTEGAAPVKASEAVSEQSDMVDAVRVMEGLQDSEKRETQMQKPSAPVIQRPKDLGDIRGVSYIYAMFYRFGIIDVPEKVKAKMGR